LRGNHKVYRDWVRFAEGLATLKKSDTQLLRGEEEG